MAEKSTFENELPKKSTVKWLRGLDENGNPVLIDISDHATVVGKLIGTATPIKDGLQSKANVDSYIQINNQTWQGDKVTTVKIIPYMSFFLSVPQSEGTQSAHALYFVSVDSSLNVYCKTIGASLAGGLNLWKDNNYIYFRRGYGVAQAAGFINTCGLALEVANNISLPTSGIDSVTIS